MNTRNSTRRGQLGFTIIEALIALVIMGFGILSLAGMQAALSRNADDAKQRTEAVRLAQEKIESFRSYTGIASTVIGQGTTSTTALNWAALTSSVNLNDTITTNAVYTRTWTLGGTNDDPMRGLTVNVTWEDRAGDDQTVSLSTVLSQSDPADSGILGFPLPLNTHLKRPKDRNLDIPIPAIDLGNGESAVKFGEDGQYVLFGNISGDVVKICTPTLNGTPTSAEVITALTSVNADTTNCTIITGYIVAGYVGRDSSVSNADWSAIESGLGIDYSGVSRNAAGATGITCQFGDATNQNTGAIIANYKYYLCVIPLAAPSLNAPYDWSGTIRIAGPSAWNASGNKYYVCRYQYTATNSLTDVNQRNVQPYVAVNKSIDQQNYLIATTANGNSATAPTCPSAMTVADVSAGVLHQDCRSASNASYATACPLPGATTPTYAVTYDSNGGTGTVPTDATAHLSGSTVTVITSPAPTRSGYTFSGWSLSTSGSVVTSFAITANTTLYAQWVAIPTTYTVSYSANGGTGTVPTDATAYLSGSTVTVIASPSPTRSGYTFGGWSLSTTGSAVTSFTITANTTLYARWVVVAPTTYTVSYSANGGTGTVPTDVTAYTSGSTVTVIASPSPTRSGYTFSGWSLSTSGSAVTSFTITANTTLYAQWTTIPASITLGTPAPVWTGSTNPNKLTWPIVPNATGYLVSTCATNNKNSLTACTPTGSSSNTTRSLSPAPGSKDTICYSVIATGLSPYTNSPSSSVKCIFQKTNTYEYQ